MEHKEIKSENGEVHYWISHCKDISAKCIVFSHGLTANHEMFDKQVKRFEKEYTLISWDIPMHGLSRPYKNFSYEQTAIELHRILEKEKISKVVLVGMSIGGYPSQMFASMFPEMVEGFIALDTTPFGLKYYSESDLWWLKRASVMAIWIPDFLIRGIMAKSVSKTEYSYNQMMTMLKPLTKSDIIWQMKIAYGKFAEENRDISLSAPVLILVGDRDITGKVKTYCEAWSKATGYPLHIIKHAAHFSNGDNYEQVNEEIEAFIKEL